MHDLPEHGTATTKARGGLGTNQTSWARCVIKIMAQDSCELTLISTKGTETSKQIYFTFCLGGTHVHCPVHCKHLMYKLQTCCDCISDLLPVQHRQEGDGKH